MSVIIANMLKYYQKNYKESILYVFLSNYFIAAILSYLLYPFSFAGVEVFDYTMGSIVGVMYLINFLILNRNIQENGMSLSIAVMRISLIIPIIISLILFKESVHTVNFIGIAVIIITFFMLGQMKNRLSIILLLLLFLLTGISDFGMKFYEYYGNNSINTYLFFLFAAAFVFNALIILIKRERFSPNAIIFGLILGFPNQLTSYFFMKSLISIPAAIAYPMLGAGVALISVLSDKFIWKSKLSIKQIIILILLMCGIILINIR